MLQCFERQCTHSFCLMHHGMILLQHCKDLIKKKLNYLNDQSPTIQQSKTILGWDGTINNWTHHTMALCFRLPVRTLLAQKWLRHFFWICLWNFLFFLGLIHIWFCRSLLSFHVFLNLWEIVLLLFHHHLLPPPTPSYTHKNNTPLTPTLGTC